jgi:hypothetical protein
MSFEKLSKKDLVAAAEEFGVEATGTKEVIIAALDAEGVTFELYQSLHGTGEEETEGVEVQPIASDGVYGPVTGEDTILVYKSANGSYGNAYGNWSDKSPFVIVAKSVADGMIEEMPGLFEVASESQVEAFYN